MHYLVAFATRTALGKPHFQGEVYVSMASRVDPTWGHLVRVEFRDSSRVVYRSLWVTWPQGRILCSICRGQKVLAFGSKYIPCRVCDGLGYTASILEEEPYQDEDFPDEDDGDQGPP